MYKNIVDKYIKEVQSGKLIACEFVKLAITRHLADLERTDIYFDEDAANHFLKFSSYCKYTKGQLAKEKRRIELTPQQVYNKLISNLPYNETRKYLKKVNDRVSAYNKLLRTTI